jgi:hypothetical protein
MKRLRFTFPFIAALFIGMLLVASGFGVWVFGQSQSTSATLNLNAKDNLFVDDIAENYYYASDLSPKNYFNVYVFAAPKDAYAYKNRSDTSLTPTGSYDAYKSNTYSVTSHGTTTSAALGSDLFGYWYSDPSNTSDGTAYGYKTFKNVYKKLSLAKYQSLGSLVCNVTDVHNWPNFFAGFTADVDTASSYGYSSYAQATMFDLNKPLSDYDPDGDNNIYLYPLYTQGKNYSQTNVPPMRLYDSTSAITGINRDKAFEWYFVRSQNTFTDSGYLPYYYTMNSVVVKDSIATGTTRDNTVYYKSQTYKVQTDPTQTGGWYGNWNTVSFDFSSLFNSTLEAGSVYNFHVYYNQKSTNTNLIPTSVNTYFSSMNIVSSWTSAVTTIPGGYGQMKIFIEKVYDYQLDGDITNSFAYNGSSTVYSFRQNTARNGTQYIYYSQDIIFPDKNKLDFVVNYGSTYADSVITADPNATGTAYPCYVSDDTADTTVSTDPSGNDVYYLSDSTHFAASPSQDPATNTQSLKVFRLAHSGVYRFRIAVTYTSGNPTSILLSAAYLRGAFLEVFDTNPTSTIHMSDGTDTGFVAHTGYQYRCDENYDDAITLDEKIFYANGNKTVKYSLNEILAAKGTAAKLYDHVTGQYIQITSAGFSSDTGLTWNSSFTLNKDYIFYFVS